MKNVLMLESEQALDLLEKVAEESVQVIVSYISRNKWHVARASIRSVDSQKIDLETTQDDKDHPQPLNIRQGDSVGVSFKFAYAKFIFDSLIHAFQPSDNQENGGVITIDFPDSIQAVQRRSYFRVQIPKTIHIDVAVWPRRSKWQSMEVPSSYKEGRLVDLSAGGAQIAVPKNAFNVKHGSVGPFHKGQFIGLRFRPQPYAEPLILNAQIRNLVPTIDGKIQCMGVQIVGLESSSEGRQILAMLANIVEQYHQMNQEESGRKKSVMGMETVY